MRIIRVSDEILEDSRQWQEMNVKPPRDTRLSWVVLVAPGDLLPRWFYMLGRYDFWSNVSYFYPVPIAFYIRVAERLRRWWDSTRSHPTPLQRRMCGLIRRAEAHAYSRGCDAGVERALRLVEREFRARVSEEARVALSQLRKLDS